MILSLSRVTVKNRLQMSFFHTQYRPSINTTNKKKDFHFPFRDVRLLGFDIDLNQQTPVANFTSFQFFQTTST